MGERAAARTNKVLDRVSSLYVGKNFGYTRKYAESYERVFGSRKAESGSVAFSRGPLGLEITWSWPPVVSGLAAGGQAERAGVEVGSTILEIGGVECHLPLPELELEDLMARRPLTLRFGEVPAAGAEPAARSPVATSPVASAVCRVGVAAVPGALGADACAALRHFVLEVHFDAPARCLFTAFVALQDVTSEMGPTIFLPGTNTQVAHRRLQAEPGVFLAGRERVVAVLGAGDAVVYDSRVLHCGGANKSEKTRALMYLTFRPPAVDPKGLGVEQHSIRAELVGQYRLGDFRTP